jgi:hypothetical protein
MRSMFNEFTKVIRRYVRRERPDPLPRIRYYV